MLVPPCHDGGSDLAGSRLLNIYCMCTDAASTTLAVALPLHVAINVHVIVEISFVRVVCAWTSQHECFVMPKVNCYS